MRIGFFTECYRPIVNGIVASVDGLAEGLRGRGHEVYLFAPRAPGYGETDGPVFRMPSLPLPTSTPYRLTLPLVSRRNLNRVIKRLDVIHAHSPFVTGWMAVHYARRFGIPLVYTYHTRLEAYAHYIPFEPHATRRAATRLTRNFANHADAVIVPTTAMRDRLLEVGVTACVEVVHSGIDLRRFGAGTRRESVRREAGVGAGQRMALFVSRLAREKNVSLLFEALACGGDPALHLVVAGDGPDREAFEERARLLHIQDRTHFLGAIDRDRLPDLYASADVFVFPSVSETQGLVLAEAMAAGAFVIAADAGQNREVLGDAGRVVPAEAAAFAEAMRSLPADSTGYAERARRQAARFSIDEQTARVVALYSRLLAEEKTVLAGS